MRLNSWTVWSAVATAAAGVAVNLATEWKHDILAWFAVLVLAVLVGCLGSMADQSGMGKVADRRKRQEHPVLRWDEQNGTARRTVSTTSEKVASQFLRSVPPPLSSSHEPPSTNTNNL